MKKFYIITNEIKDKDYVVTGEVKSCIESMGGEVVLATKENHKLAKECDYILSLGGDGTLIGVAGSFHDLGIPMIGINLGHLGYLTEIERDNITEGIAAIFAGEYSIEDRMMLSGNIGGAHTSALNDIVLSRKGSPRILHFDIFINGAFLHSYKADGIIIATPTGSTGYNMSAGGPIVDPIARLLLVTPICAHSLHGRSIVLSATDVIEIELREDHQGGKEAACVSFDGETVMDLQHSDKLLIKQCEHNINLIRLNQGSFLETLRKKMEN